MSSCPNNCIDGWRIDPYLHKRVRCEYCLEKRAEEIKSPEVREQLKLPLSLTNGEFLPETVFPQKDMDEESVSFVLDAMKKLVGDVSIGELPDHSMLFNLGKEVHENNFLNPLLLKAYAGGMECLPVQTSLDIVVSRRLYERGDEKEDVIPFKELISKSVCVVTIDAGETYEGVLAVKGLMQLRARAGKPTVILTHLWNKYVRALCTENEVKCYNMAMPYSIRYISSEPVTEKNNSTRGYHGQLTREQFDGLKKSNNFM